MSPAAVPASQGFALIFFCRKEYLHLWRRGNPCALLVGMEISVATVENSIKALQKLKK